MDRNFVVHTDNNIYDVVRIYLRTYQEEGRMTEHTKHLLDLLAIAAAFLSTLASGFVNALPWLASFLSCVWMILRIIETSTGKTIPELLKGK